MRPNSTQQKRTHTQVIEYVSVCVCSLFVEKLGWSFSFMQVEEMATRWWLVGKGLGEREENGSMLVTCAMAKLRLTKEEKD